MEVYLLGTSHKKAEVQFREKIAFAPDSLPDALRSLVGLPGVDEGLILSTCNRTEIYVVSSSGAEIYQNLRKFLEKHTGVNLSADLEFFYREAGKDAIHHLFQVASGLDSMILGEPQILGQLKDAFRQSAELGTAGVILHRLLHTSFTAGKRVRSETALGAGAVSVAYAAVELAQKIFKDLSRHTVLLVGAGETGELTARHFREKGVGKLFITNRTFDKAQTLAEELTGTAIPFDEMRTILPRADIIVGAASAPNFLIRRDDVEKIVPLRSGRPLFMIDIGVPRDFDPDINELEMVFLHDIDALEQIIQKNLEKRRLEIPRAEKIIEEEIQNYLEWKRGLQVTPTIISLRQKLDLVRKAELDKNKNRLTDEELKKVDMISRAILNKILHMPTTNLKKYSNGHPDGLLRIDVVRELFELEEEK